ncbi:hypothetical protein A0256_03570 [Mucilaginibacter sp. PAMC 26640]|nr:hypothetical protein A0256_03570 [Mucilaginibacter sp. PAMC 26640]
MAFKRFFFGLIIFAGIAGVCGFVIVEDPIPKITRQLAKWADNHPIEKVYLHLDKPYYGAGDDVFFKAYVTTGGNNQLSAISGVLHVQLLNARGAVKQYVKLQLSNGTAAGDFALPDTLSAGNYRIRAFTNYMRNTGNDYFFDEAISIINSISPNTKVPAKAVSKKGILPAVAPAKPDVQFFPEGGYLLNGFDCQVAFKAIGPDGFGMDAKGTVVDAAGKQVASFNSTHLGMGTFTFSPQAGTSYTAKVTTADGTSLNIVLPKAQDKGYALHITDADEGNLDIKIAIAKATLLEDPNRIVTLMAQSGGKVHYAAKSKPGSTMFTARVAKSKFPAGIIQFTLFSDSGEPLNERLVFIHHPEKLKLNLSADRQSYSPQQKVKMNILASGLEKPMIGSFSVSVTDETRLPVNEDGGINILACLLLTADLKGYVEKPAYYFNNVSDKTRADRDMLMLTQGYRRFNWRDLLGDKIGADNFQPEKALQVSGTVTTPGGKPVPNGKVQLIDIDDATYTLDTLTDARGRFAFTNLAFNDSIRLIIQARTAKNKKDVIIRLDSIAPPATARGKNAPALSVRITDTLTVYSRSSKQLYDMQRRYGVGNHVISLQEVTVREKKIALKHSANLNGPGNADQVMLARDFRNYGCIYLSDCLQGRLVGVIFRNGIPYSTRSFRPMQIILDGVYVDGNYLNSINVNDVAAIEILRSGANSAIYGGRAGNGVIIVTTKRGDDRDNAYDGPVTGRGIKAYEPKGYYKARSFYSPLYDQPKTNKQLADLRSTIYWNPGLVTDKDGKTSFEYFNGGSRGTYRVVIEGIDTDGNIGRMVYRYKVQ